MAQLDATEIALVKITDLLVNHTYKPGDRLLETVLASELNLSRTPIRDALSRLVASGFVEKQKGQKGYSIPLLTPEDMKHVFQTRMFLEGHAVRMAAPVCSSKDIAYLRGLNEREIEAFHNKHKEVYASSNEAFHFYLAKIANNNYISRYIEQTFWRSRLYIFFFAGFYTLEEKLVQYSDEHHKTSYSEHREIIDALENRDAEKSGKLMEDHIKKTYFHLLNPRSQRENNLQDL